MLLPPAPAAAGNAEATEPSRRADVVGIFPNEDSILCLIGATPFKQNDDWQSQYRYMMG